MSIIFEGIIGVFGMLDNVLKHFNHVWVLLLVHLGVFKGISMHHRCFWDI